MIRYAARFRSAITTAAAVVALGMVALAGCGSSGESRSNPASGGDATSSEGGGERALTVFAAASLKQTFETIGARFEQEHPGVDLRFNFGGSSGLVAQLEQGAPGDVLATANEQTMTKARGAGLIAGTPTIFATNTLTIAVPQGNPGKVTRLADLTNPRLKVVVCAPAVPCGAATREIEKSAGVDISPVSEEQSVTDVLGKVRSSQADAGLVYVTDVKGADGEVDAVSDPAFDDAVNRYPIATVADSGQAALAREFVNAVLAEEGQKALATAGFGPAPGS